MQDYRPVVLLILCLLRPGLAQRIFTLCEVNSGYTAPNHDLLLSNDVWNPDASGSQCMITNGAGSTFQVNWTWPNGAGQVHSYPHINFYPEGLPMKISDIESLEIDASWDMCLSADPSVGVSNLAANGVICNFIIDLFCDDDPAAATSEVNSSYEIMIWLAWFGTSYPLGWDKGSVWSQTIGGNVYDLYVGTDPSGHTAYSWLTTSVVQEVQFDIAPLLKAMVEHSLIDSNAMLGLIELGSEAFYSTHNVTLTVENYAVNMNGNLAAPPSAAQSSTPGQYLEMPPNGSVATLTPQTTAVTESLKKANTAASFTAALGSSSWVAILCAGMILRLAFD